MVGARCGKGTVVKKHTRLTRVRPTRNSLCYAFAVWKMKVQSFRTYKRLKDDHVIDTKCKIMTTQIEKIADSENAFDLSHDNKWRKYSDKTVLCFRQLMVWSHHVLELTGCPPGRPLTKSVRRVIFSGGISVSLATNIHHVTQRDKTKWLFGWLTLEEA